MFDFLDEFDLEDFVVGVNLIDEFEKDQKDELDSLNDPDSHDDDDVF